MSQLKIIGFFIIIILGLVYTQVALADRWYTGNGHSNAKGIKAWIYTPSSPLYIEQVGESSWVSTAYGDWVQTGWLYQKGWSTPRPYVEHHIGGMYGLNEYGSQSWGTGVEYKVMYSESSTWYAYINGNSKGGWGPHYAPKDVLGLSEVHESSNNELNTQFSNVYYKNTANRWTAFNEGNWIENFPYEIEKTKNYRYRNYGP